MSYELSRTQKNIKLLLESERLDYGTLSTPTFTLRENIEAPPNSYLSAGVEKIFFRHPYFLPSSQAVCSLQAVKYSGVVVGSGQDVTPEDFDALSLSSGTPIPSVTIRDIAITGDTEQIVLILDGLLSLFSQKANLIDARWVASDPNYPLLYVLSHSDWGTDDWSTMTYQQKKSGIQNWWLNGRKGLHLQLKRPWDYYNTDIKMTGPLLTEFFGYKDGSSFTWHCESTSTTAEMMSPEKLSLDNIKWTGYDFIKIFSNLGFSYRQGSTTNLGLSNTNLIAMVPLTSLPGGYDYYVHPGSTERLLTNITKLDHISYRITDPNDNEITDIQEFNMILSLEFVKKEEEEQHPSMKYGRENY